MIPTAEEFFDNYFKSKTMTGAQLSSVKSAMIEFANLHCEAQAKAILKNAELERDAGQDLNGISINKESILNAYPLTNIK